MGKPIYWLFCTPSPDSLQLFAHVSHFPLFSRNFVDRPINDVAVAILLKNRVPLAPERAALSEALYHAAIDFVSRAPVQVATNPSRFFEAVSDFFPPISTFMVD